MKDERPRKLNEPFGLAWLEECVTDSVRGIGADIADVPEGIGAEAFSQLSEVEALRSNGLALRFDEA